MPHIVTAVDASNAFSVLFPHAGRCQQYETLLGEDIQLYYTNCITRASSILRWQIFLSQELFWLNLSFLFRRWSTLRSSCEAPDTFVRFNQMFGSLTDFYKSLKYKISLKSIQWEPRWYTARFATIWIRLKTNLRQKKVREVRTGSETEVPQMRRHDPPISIPAYKTDTQCEACGVKAFLLCRLEPLAKICTSSHDKRIQNKAPTNHNQIVINRNS